MHLPHVLLSHLCISLQHHLKKKTRENQKKQKTKDLATSPEIRVVLETLFFLFFLVFSSFGAIGLIWINPD